MLLTTISVFLLLCLSGFFSGSETALTGASEAYMQEKDKNENNSRAKTINHLFKKRDRLIITTLIGSNLSNTLATSLSTSLLVSIFGNQGIAYATLIMTILVLIYTDMLPKTYSVKNANKVALAVAPLISFFVKIFTPVAYVLQKITSLTFKLFSLDKNDSGEEMAISEIRGAIDMYDGLEIKEEKHMLKSILDLADITVYDVITHRKNLFCLSIDMQMQDIIIALKDCPYSRVPLYKDKPENIVGVLIVRNLLKKCLEVGEDLSKVNISDIMIKPWFIPENTNLLHQLSLFKTRREHFAIVIDEYGDIDGIITMEDILEEIVGDINDENDIFLNENSQIKRLDDKIFLIDGEVSIRDLNRQNGWKINDDNMTTIAGYLLDMTRIIPKEGQEFIFENFKFEIIKRTKNQINLIKITKLD